MFLDEELTQIWESKADFIDRARRIKDACNRRIDPTSTAAFVSSVRRIDASFRLFPKRTDGINGDFFKDSLTKVIREEKNGNTILRMLRWK